MQGSYHVLKMWWTVVGCYIKTEKQEKIALTWLLCSRRSSTTLEVEFQQCWLSDPYTVILSLRLWRDAGTQCGASEELIAAFLAAATIRSPGLLPPPPAPIWAGGTCCCSKYACGWCWLWTCCWWYLLTGKDDKGLFCCWCSFLFSLTTSPAAA